MSVSRDEKFAFKRYPESERMSPKKGPFQKERIVFQPSIFQGQAVSFRGVYMGVSKNNGTPKSSI